MQAVYFLVVAVIQLGIAIYGTQKTRQHFNYYALLVLIVVFGLAYDNFAIAAGGFVPQGDLLKWLNAPRYWVHALVTPAMIIAAFGALRMTGSKFAQSKTWHGVFCVLATALIALGSYTDILNLTLEPTTEAGLTRYVNTFEFLKGPPIPAVLTVLVVLIFGGVLWRNAKFPWLFFGALIMFGAAGVTGMPIVQNIGEIAFAAGLVVTQIFAAQHAHS
jgi:hypothetical protein